MKQNFQTLLLFCALMGFSLATPWMLQAEEEHATAPASLRVDAVLLLDASGSMRITDPERLRDEGAKLFAQFLKPGDRLGIVQFAENSSTLRPLSDYSKESEAAVEATIKQVDNSGTYTDLLAGLKTAEQMLEQSPREGSSRVIVLLSDGKMDPDPAHGAVSLLTSELKNELLPDLKSKGIKVHTLAFSEQADKDLLAEIALATDGSHWFTPASEKIHESFAELFLVVKKPQVLPLRSTGFKIDSDVSEATFYINRSGAEEIKIITPAGVEITPNSKETAVNWFQSKNFDVITIEKPEIGNWQVQGLPKNDGFATLLTSVKLLTDWPTQAIAREPVLLQARLYENDKPIALTNMTEVVKYAFKITPTDKVSEPIITEALYDDGSHGDKVEADGVYSNLVTLKDTGEYRLHVLAIGPTFERHQEIPFRVKPPMVSLTVASVEEEPAPGSGANAGAEHENEHGKGHEPTPAKTLTKDYFRVLLSQEVLQMKKVDIKLVAVDKEHKRYTLPLTRSTDGLRYEVPASILKKDGEYELQSTMTAEGKRKERIRSVSEVLTYTKTTAKLDENKEHEEVLVEDEAPVVEEPPQSPLLYIILLTLINAGAAGGCGFMLSKMKSSSGNEKIEFSPVDQFTTAIAELDARSKLTEIALDDPMLIQSAQSISVAPATAAPAAEPAAAPADQAAAPATEESAESGATEEPTPPEGEA